MPIAITSISALKDNYIWLLTDPENRYAVVVDPGEAAPVLAKLAKEKIRLLGILITHHHWDHTNGVTGLLKEFKVPVYGPTKEANNIVTHPLQENDVVKISELNLELKVLDIPGHTLGHIAYYNEEFVFTGDTLFTGGCGRLFEGTAAQLYNSLTKLAALPEHTKIYCGHEYTAQNLKFALTVEPNNILLKKRIAAVAQLREQNLPTVPATVAIEKQTNPFLHCDSVNNFATLRLNKDNFSG